MKETNVLMRIDRFETTNKQIIDKQLNNQKRTIASKEKTKKFLISTLIVTTIELSPYKPKQFNRYIANLNDHDKINNF